MSDGALEVTYQIPHKGDTVTAKDAASECGRIAEANGFQRPDWSTNFAHKTAYILTELVEGVDFLHGGDGDPFEEELADAAIRIMDLLEGLWGGDWCSRVEYRRPREGQAHPFAPPEVLVWPIVHQVGLALEAYRHESKKNAQQHLELALLETFRVADRIDCDLMEEIRLKCHKNKQRAYLHGKARSEG